MPHRPFVSVRRCHLTIVRTKGTTNVTHWPFRHFVSIGHCDSTSLYSRTTCTKIKKWPQLQLTTFLNTMLILHNALPTWPRVGVLCPRRRHSQVEPCLWTWQYPKRWILHAAQALYQCLAPTAGEHCKKCLQGLFPTTTNFYHFEPQWVVTICGYNGQNCGNSRWALASHCCRFEATHLAFLHMTRVALSLWELEAWLIFQCSTPCWLPRSTFGFVSHLHQACVALLHWDQQVERLKYQAYFHIGTSKPRGQHGKRAANFLCWKFAFGAMDHYLALPGLLLSQRGLLKCQHSKGPINAQRHCHNSCTLLPVEYAWHGKELFHIGLPMSST